MGSVKAQAEIAERRLRPVYDALDNANNKQAIKLADNVLKKQKDFSCAKALKALALIRSGRTDESHLILENLKSSNEKLDEATLQAVTMCYKESSNPFGVMDIYNVAVKQSPKNEEFLSHYFMACVRVSEYSKQQQAAMNLYKAYPKNPYYFWAVMSTYMQAYVSLDMKRKSMFLSLAERMIEKFMKEGKMEAEEEIRLYMMILEEQGKYEELLKLLQNDFRDKLKCILNEKEEKEIEYLTLLTKWPELNIKCKLILEKFPDDWSYFQRYFASLFELLKAKYTPDKPVDTENIQPDHTYEQSRVFLEKLEAEHEFLRGPVLAKMELIVRWVSENSLELDQESLFNHLELYFQKFGSKPCCFTDIRQYTKLLDKEYRKKFIDQLSTYIICIDDNSSVREKVQRLYQEIAIECFSLQLEYYKELSYEDKFTKAKGLMKKYNDTLKLGSDLKSTEPQYGDALVLLAVYLLLQLNKEKGDDSVLWHALLFLEEAVECSQTFAQFKLLLMYIYAKIGAFGAVSHLIEDTDVKYIMFDSIGYFLNHGSYISGQFQATRHLYDSAISFYNANRKDTPEQIIAAYKYGSFRQDYYMAKNNFLVEIISTVPDITNLKSRLETSFNQIYIRIESIYLDLMRYANSVQEVKKHFEKIHITLKTIKFEDLKVDYLSDNRDLRMFDRFDSYDRESAVEKQRKSLDINILWLRYRYLMLQSLHIGSNHLSSANGHIINGVIADEKDTQSTDTLVKCISLLKETMRKSREHPADMTWPCPYEPPPCHIKLFEEGNFHNILLPLLATMELLSKQESITEEVANSSAEQFKNIEVLLKENAQLIEDSMIESRGSNKMFNGKSLPRIVFWIETCYLAAIILSTIKTYLNEKFMRRGRKKKNTPQSMQCQPLLTSIKELCSSMSNRVKKLLESLNDIKEKYVDETLDTDAIEELFEKTNSTTVTKVWQKIQASYQQSILELIQLFEKKITLLNEIGK